MLNDYYPFITDSTVLDQTSIFALVLVLGVNGSLEFFTLAKYRALLTADQRTYVISLASIVYTVLNTIIVKCHGWLGHLGDRERRAETYN